MFINLGRGYYGYNDRCNKLIFFDCENMEENIIKIF